MATSTPTARKAVRGPVLGIPHLLQLRSNPIGHNEFLREAYGEVYRLNVFGVSMFVTAASQVCCTTSLAVGPSRPRALATR